MVQKKNLQIKIKEILTEGEKNFSQLSLALKCNRNSLQKELTQLEKNGVVEKKKKGNATTYRLILDYTETERDLVWDLSNMIKIEKDVDLVISKKYVKEAEGKDSRRGILSMYELGKIKSVFTITNDVKGFGFRNKFEKEQFKELDEEYKKAKPDRYDELVKDGLLKKDLDKDWFSFKTNPKAKKLLYYITDLHDYCVGKSIEAMMMEVFWPKEARTELGKKAQKELQRLGLSVAAKIRTHVLKSVGGRYARCYEMYLSNQSTLWLMLKDFINDPAVFPKEKRQISDEKYEELGTKLIRELWVEEKKRD